MATIVRVAAIYVLLIFLDIVFGFIVAARGWRKHGLFLSTEESRKVARELYRERHWTAIASMWIHSIAFFWYVIPIAWYERFVKHNKNASIDDPRGRYSD
jgi:hypothetical protein